MKPQTLFLFLGLAVVHQVVVSAPTKSLISESKVPLNFHYGSLAVPSNPGPSYSISVSPHHQSYNPQVDRKAGYQHGTVKRYVSDMLISELTTKAINITAPFAWTNVISFLFRDTNTNSSHHCEWSWPVTYSLNTTKITPPKLNLWHQCGTEAEYQVSGEIWAFKFMSFTNNHNFSMVYLHEFMTSDDTFREYESATVNVHTSCEVRVVDGCQIRSPLQVPVAVIE